MNKKTRFATLLVATTLVSFAALSVSAQPLVARTTINPTTSNITTLYANDPVAHSLCLIDGKEGGVMKDGGVFNRCSQIEFDSYKTGSLSVAVEGGDIGKIIDLGTAEDLSKQYGYQETVGKGQGFASIVFRDGKVLIAKERYKAARQELTQATQLFEDNQSTFSLEAKAGHIYLVRIADQDNKETKFLVKLLVLSAHTGESVTFRWELL